MTTEDEKQKAFKEEVAKGLHPDWVIEPNGELKFVGKLAEGWQGLSYDSLTAEEQWEADKSRGTLDD